VELTAGIHDVGIVIATGIPEQAKVLVWAIIGIELARGVADDVYMITQGYDPTVYMIWIVIHTVVIVTGLLSLRSAGLMERGGLRE